ncbi:MAG: hypothetical protein NC085_12065 [Muribaculaceae bacterium]|nr:hypothetical protein [Muribaculaceae bacterium]
MVLYKPKIVKNACKAAIEIAQNYTFDDNRNLSRIYHLIKLARASAREFADTDKELSEMFDTLSMYAAKLKRNPDVKIIQVQYVLTCVNTEVSTLIPMPISNAHFALIKLIRQSLKNKAVDDYIRLYDVSNLYVQRLFQYCDWVNAHREIENYELISGFLLIFVAEIRQHTSWLESAMKFNGIAYEKILM